MKLLVTGSSGLVGSAVVERFAELGQHVIGLDDNTRADLFGAGGDTTANRERLEAKWPKRFTHLDVDVRDRAKILALVDELRPDAVVHAAAQPSHDLAAERPFDDFDINAGATLNLLEACRRSAAEAPFVFLSTNKVYGDVPNELPRQELATRFDYARPEDHDGVDENMRLDRSDHSLFGVSKLAADVLVQEYGRAFGLPTCCLRAGCLTGANHAGVELHGFLSHLVKTARRRERYTVIGFGGKQVRDNLHADDVARFVQAFIEAPRTAEVYNLGGGRERSCSVLEAIDLVESALGEKLDVGFDDTPRRGDHVVYISNLQKTQAHYPSWSPQVSLEGIIEELCERAGPAAQRG